MYARVIFILCQHELVQQSLREATGVVVTGGTTLTTDVIQ